jgi:hypothetical protein
MFLEAQPFCAGQRAGVNPIKTFDVESFFDVITSITM